MVDAIIALAILAGVFAIGSSALVSALKASRAASELRTADATLSYVLNRRPIDIGSHTGRLGRFVWRTDTDIVADQDAGGPVICARQATVTSAISGRRYHMGTTAFCRRPRPAQ